MIPRVLRIRSVPETLSVDGAMDTSVVVKGGQNLSYSYDEPFVKQRMDRILHFGSKRPSLFTIKFTKSNIFKGLWYYAQPSPAPLEFSLVVHGGKGFAGVVAGDMILFIFPIRLRCISKVCKPVTIRLTQLAGTLFLSRRSWKATISHTLLSRMRVSTCLRVRPKVKLSNRYHY